MFPSFVPYVQFVATRYSTFSLSDADHEVVESIGQMHVKVQRSSGARGHVAVPYKTIDGTAKAGRDYIATQGEVVFANDEHE